MFFIKLLSNFLRKQYNTYIKYIYTKNAIGKFKHSGVMRFNDTYHGCDSGTSSDTAALGVSTL